ncbi:MAG: hypothetical protein WCQ23_02645 [Candidatus Methanomethylophilaceae archaeon]|mgnify:CR=1 FL=1|jgi:hypothetical protein
MGFMDKMKDKKAEHDAKKAGKEKNYTLHVVGTIIIAALAITVLYYWFPF